MKYTIDLQSIDGQRELHFEFAKAMSFPEYYGNNLDALYDVLTDISEETEIEVLNFDIMREKLGRYAENFRRVLLDSAAENENLKISI